RDVKLDQSTLASQPQSELLTLDAFRLRYSSGAFAVRANPRPEDLAGDRCKGQTPWLAVWKYLAGCHITL
ncbi:MAG: hypothetical protein P4L81_02610, partial [Candidatus Pacebacteria bacterium]|nr:hypothetical protein [Candidatus Paceibacterota bacterium]